MVRYSVAAVLGGLYAIGSAWLVHSAGAAHRDALRRERPRAVRAEMPAPQPPEELPIAAPAATTPEPTPPRPESGGGRAAVVVASPPSRPTHEGPPPARIVTGRAEAKTEPAPTPGRAPAPTTGDA